MKRDVKTVAGWDFERLIPCHGVRVMSRRFASDHSDHFSHRTSSRRMGTKHGGKHLSGILTEHSTGSFLSE